MLNLATVKQVLEDSTGMVNDLHGMDLEDLDAHEHKRRKVAEVTRDLLQLADQLVLASSLVRNEYWFAKGYRDSLDLERTE